MTRPKTYTIAALLQFLLSAFSAVATLPLLARGTNEIDQAGNTPPYFVIVLAFVTALLGIVSAYGVWRVQKWGVILTILLRAVDGIAALPGIQAAPTIFFRIAAIMTVLVSITIIVLLLWPKRRLTPTSPNLP